MYTCLSTKVVDLANFSAVPATYLGFDAIFSTEFALGPIKLHKCKFFLGGGSRGKKGDCFTFLTLLLKR